MWNFWFLSVLIFYVSSGFSLNTISRSSRRLNNDNIYSGRDTGSWELLATPSSSPSASAPIEPGSPQQQQQQQQHILLVDDEPEILHAVSQLLQQHNYNVTTCDNGATALETIVQQQVPAGPGNLLQAVISDIRMPLMDGLNLLRAIRSNPQTADIPVILLTAKGLPMDRVAGYDAGADAYLPKPFDPAELLAILENVLQRHQDDNNNQQPPDMAIRELQRDLDDIQSMLLQSKQKKAVFLTPDERSILELLCEGLTNKEIGARSYLSSRRVEQVLTVLFRKAKVKNRTELVRWAVATGQVKL